MQVTIRIFVIKLCRVVIVSLKRHTGFDISTSLIFQLSDTDWNYFS